MASPQQPTAGSSPTPEVVGNAFVHQYYHILHQSPELVYRFYQDNSKLGRPEPDGTLSSITTMQAINEKILSLDYSDCRAEIKTVEAQESYEGGVIVLVTGYLTGKDGVRRNFTQSFFLAPQDKGYFVLNDLFRYVEDVVYHDGNKGLANGVATTHPTPDQDPAQGQWVAEQTTTLPEEEVNGEEMHNPSDNEDGSVVEEEEPTPEVVDEIPNNVAESKILNKVEESKIPNMVAESKIPNKVAESKTVIQEEVPKKSYASIVKVMKESGGPVSVPTPSPARPAPSNQERLVLPPPPPAPAAEIPVSSLNAVEGDNNQEGECMTFCYHPDLVSQESVQKTVTDSVGLVTADGHSIYLRNLPLNATPLQLEEEFKKFGPIKSGGIQVRSNKQQGFCFGFVEFEVATAVQSAIEASPVTIGGRQAVVEEKRTSSSRVNNRGRFPSGRGNGFRNDGTRGRGSYGNGRGYGRNDFGNRSDFGNRGGNGSRGGSFSRGFEGGNHRADNGARANRTGGLAVNATAKNVAPRVPVPV